MVFKSIKIKLLAYYFFAISLILAVFSILILYLFYKQNIKTIDAQLYLVAQEINLKINKKHGIQFANKFLMERDFNIENLYIHIYEYKDNTYNLSASNTILYNKFPKDVVKKNKYYFTIKNPTKLREIILKSTHLENVYFKVSTTIDDKTEESMDSLFYTLLILEPIVTLIVLLLGFFLISNTFKRVQKVINEVHEIKIDDLAKRINTLDSQDEIGELVDTFNLLLDRIENGFDKIKRFSNDVSHELKTPLTVLRGEIELGLRKDRTIKEYKKILSTVLSETKSLQELIDKLLFLSHENEQEIENTFSLVYLDEILLDTMNEQMILAKEKNIEFNMRGLNSVTKEGNEILLKILIGNILSNAIKYSHIDSKIDIALYEDGMSIKDYGIGIKEDELKNIFDRFYRADSARNRDSGFGLGLSIVSNIAAIHGIEIDVKSEFNKYTEVTLLF